MAPVVNCLTDRVTSYSGLEQILELPQRLVLVVAQAGMGKSMELTHISSELKCKDPTTWVVRIDLREHKYPDHNRMDVLQLLSNAANFNSQFERSLFEYEVNHDGNVVVFMDGFDEIIPKYSEKVLKILKDLLATNVKHIFVTSRHVMREELEAEFCTLSFDLKSFTKCEQEEFLVKFWKVSADSCGGFIESLLKLTESSLGNRTLEFMGIPLQIRMLAEIFKSEALHYSMSGEVNLPPKLDLLMLYQRFMDRMWEIYCKKMNLDINSAVIEEMVEQRRKEVQSNFMCCALVMLLDDDLPLLSCYEKIQQENDNFVMILATIGDRRGIVTSVKNGRAVFFHQTFAEYFTGLWFSYNFRTEFECLRLKHIDGKFEIVRQFFDRILCENCDLHVAVLNQEKLSIIAALLLRSKDKVNEKDKGGRTALHLAITYSVSQNYNDIIQLLLDNGADCNIEDNVFRWKPLQLAEEIRAWSALGLLLENRPERNLTVIPQNIEIEGLLDEVSRVAALHGYVQLVDCMLNCGVKVQRLISDFSYYVGKGWDYNFLTLLHLAAKHGQLKLVKFLVDREANINAGDKFRHTPLLNAISNRHLEVAEYLISKGATFANRDFHGYNALLLAAEKGMGSLVQTLLFQGADVKTTNVVGNTALHFAAGYCDAYCVIRLLDSGLNVNCKNKWGETPLMWAARMGNLEVVKLFCERGAGTDLYSASLHPATAAGHLKIVDCLVQHGAKLEVLTEDRDSLLHVAAKNGHLDVVEYLLKQQAAIMASNAMGDSPLHVACDSGHAEIADYLLEHGANPLTYNLLKDTPLHIATDKGHLEVVKCLLKHKVNLTNVNKVRNTALHVAAGKGHLSIVSYLVEHEASLIERNRDMDTPLRLGVRNDHLKVVEWLAAEGADKTAVDKRGQTSLHIAAGAGMVHVVKWLVKQGESMTVCDRMGRIPLHNAARWGHLQVVSYLSQERRSLHAQDRSGQTPLHMAAQWGHPHVVKCLLERGTSAAICNKKGQIPLKIAKGREVIHMLQAKLEENSSSD